MCRRALVVGLLPRRRLGFWMSARIGGGTSSRWERAEAVAAVVPGADRGLLVSAAWLRDIGYSPALCDTGLHTFDGACYLPSLGASRRLCRLVAHHSAAIIEAEVRGLAGELQREFPVERSVVADALTYVDMTTGPQGQLVTARQRLLEILTRYPRGHVVHQSILRASPLIVATTTGVEWRLSSVQPR